jgi:ATP-dependent exoDNAse (exonuclease V) beta subunit
MTTPRQSTDVLTTLAAAPSSAVVSIIAGAGTGKTRALTTRYVALLKADPTLTPQDIVVLTFTEKAATEMRARIIHAVARDDLLSKRFSRIDMAEACISTFHVYAATLALRHSIAYNLDPDAPFADEFASEALRKELWETFLHRTWEQAVSLPHDAVTEIAWNKDAINATIHAIFADAKSRGEDVATFRAAIAPTAAHSEVARIYVETLSHLYAAYDEALTGDGKLDLDDLIRIVPELIRAYPHERASIKVILVDEFQDTNGAQDAMMRAITPVHHGRTPSSRFVVGDPRQSIYLWRQAKPENLQRADTESPPNYRFTLRENYRSLQPILDLANRSLKEYQFHSDADRREFDANDTLIMGGAQPELPVPSDTVILAEYGDVATETRAIIKRVLELHEQHQVKHGEMAVLVRARSAALPIIAAFKRAGIPYDDGALTPFFKIPLVIDAVHTLIAASNPYAELSLTRTLWQATGVWNETTLATLRTANRGIPLWDILLQRRQDALAQQVAEALRSGFRSQSYAQPNTWARNVLVETGLWSRDGRYGQRILQRLLTECVAHASGVPSLIADLHDAIETGRDVSAPERRTDTDTINIMTVHAAKGLEFCAVFVPNARGFSYKTQTNGLTYKNGTLLLEGKDHASLEDYRRQEQNEVLTTFYVAVTRAKCWLMVSSERRKKDPATRVFYLVREHYATTMSHGILTEYSAPQQGTIGVRGAEHRDAAIVLPDLPSKPVVALTPSTMSELVLCPRRFRYTRRSGLAGMSNTFIDRTMTVTASVPNQSAYALPQPISAESVEESAEEQTPPTEPYSDDIDARLLGTLFHQVCERHARQPEQTALELVDAAVIAQADAVSVTTRTECLALTERYLRSALAQSAHPHLALEQRLNWTVDRPSAQVQFTGILDRYDGTTVVDYKIDSELNGLAERHGDQLRLYGAAIAAASGSTTLPTLTLYHARSGTVVNVDNTQTALDATLQNLDDALRWLTSGSFPALPAFATCSHCPARWLCPEGQALIR